MRQANWFSKYFILVNEKVDYLINEKVEYFINEKVMILKVNFICGDCVCFIILSSIDFLIDFMIVYLEEIYFSNIS